MKELILKKFEYDENLSREYADGLDSTWDKPNAYAHHLAGAHMAFDSLQPLIELMAKVCAAVDNASELSRRWQKISKEKINTLDAHEWAVRVGLASENCRIAEQKTADSLDKLKKYLG